MSFFNAKSFHEGMPSELALFDLPPTQVAVSDIHYQEIRPLSQISGDSPIEFLINGQNSQDYLDLKGTLLCVKLKVKKADGTALPKGEKVGPANLFLQSLFSSTEVTLQNKATITCNYNPYRAMIETLIGFGEDAKTSQLTSQLFIKDQKDKMAIADPSQGNIGLYERAKYIAESKNLDMVGPIFHDLFQMSRYLINECDLRLRLNRTKPEFSLLCNESLPAYTVDIEDIFLLARKIRCNPAVIFGHSEILKSENAKYPFMKKEMRLQSIPKDSSSFHWDNLFQGQKPTRIIVGFVDSQAVSGAYNKNPFNFENCDIQSICLYVNGLPTRTPLKLNFSADNGVSAIEAFANLFTWNGTWNKDKGNYIDRNDFASGTTLFAFELEPNYSQHGEYLSLVKSGNVRLEVQFASTLTSKLFYEHYLFNHCLTALNSFP